MARIEELAEVYGQHIRSPWQRTISGAQRVVMVIYDKELERALRARKSVFDQATRDAGHTWYEVDLTDAFARWMSTIDYRDEYFSSPDDLQLKLDAEFTEYAADQIRRTLALPEVDHGAVVALFGAGSLFGFTHVSQVLKLIEPDIRGRLVVFFPGHRDRGNNYRLLDARDGWNYLAVPIALNSDGGIA